MLLGFGFFLEGLEAALFPLGQLMAQQLTDPVFILETTSAASARVVGVPVGLPVRFRDRVLDYHRRAFTARRSDQGEPGFCRQHRHLGITYCCCDRCRDRHCARRLPNHYRYPTLLVHYYWLRVRTGTDHVRAAHDHRAGLRLRRRYHIYRDGTLGGGSRTGACQYRTRSQPFARRLRLDCLCQPVSDNVCTCLCPVV